MSILPLRIQKYIHISDGMRKRMIGKQGSEYNIAHRTKHQNISKQRLKKCMTRANQIFVCLYMNCLTRTMKCLMIGDLGSLLQFRKHSIFFVKNTPEVIFLLIVYICVCSETLACCHFPTITYHMLVNQAISNSRQQ